MSSFDKYGGGATPKKRQRDESFGWLDKSSNSSTSSGLPGPDDISHPDSKISTRTGFAHPSDLVRTIHHLHDERPSPTQAPTVSDDLQIIDPLPSGSAIAAQKILWGFLDKHAQCICQGQEHRLTEQEIQDLGKARGHRPPDTRHWPSDSAAGEDRTGIQARANATECADRMRTILKSGLA
ncbi:hypothetical protein PV08_09192 [Exophiala spinifera]|uniref:Uncharacterized protein n=1 Tax=Exophiala spinifera TaxID=91928 RepID=A0A0D2BL12_9EURO|nr:uncharacterized protein PV08_09192 [Exophiala spinifera]KIW11919.1 hypothetical protein PV08_09192 [Exophiala spinifera]